MRIFIAVILLLTCLPAHAELTCAQLGAIAQRTVEMRNQGASLARLIADVDRGDLRERLSARELALVKEVVRLSFDSTLSPGEVVEACQQGGVIVPSR